MYGVGHLKKSQTISEACVILISRLIFNRVYMYYM